MKIHRRTAIARHTNDLQAVAEAERLAHCLQLGGEAPALQARFGHFGKVVSAERDRKPGRRFRRRTACRSAATAFRVPTVAVFRRRDRGNAWWYEFRCLNKRHRHPCLDLERQPVENITEARKAERRARTDAEKGGLPDRARPRAGEFTFRHAGNQHIKRIADRQRKESHQRNHRLYVHEIVKFFGAGMPFRDLRPPRVDEYVAFCRRQTIRKWRGGKTKATDADLENAKKWTDTGVRRAPRQVNNYLKCLQRLCAIAAKVRDPVTGQPALETTIEIELEKVPRRRPRPIPDGELAARAATLPPWTQEALMLGRLFGLRKNESLEADIRHIDRERRGLRFAGGDTKGAGDEYAFGGAEGWKLVLKLERQARERGQTRLITWPGPTHQHLALAGKKMPKETKWRPLKTMGGTWRRSIGRAKVENPHRWHDVRARYITEVAKVDKAAAKGAARHQHAGTTELYIDIADTEISEAVAVAVSRRPKGAKLRAVK